MADSISIVMKMTEDISGTMKSIASTANGVSKEFEALQRRTQQLGSRYDSLNKKAASTSAEALKVKKAMDEAAKAFKKTGDEADKVEFEKLKQEYTELTDVSKQYSAAAKDTIRDINDVSNAMRKMQSGSSGSGSAPASSGSADMGLGGALAQAGLTKELADSFSGAIGALGESAIGQPIATLVSSTLSGVGTGVAAGALLGSVVPGIGTAIGAAVGGLSGLISGGTQIFEKQDDAFRSYVQEAYENQLSEQETSLSFGSTTAGSREQTQMAFAQKLGSDAAATDYLADVKDMAKNTNYTYDEITGYSKLLLNTYDTEKTLSVLQSLSDASAGLNLNSSDVNMFISGLSRMRTTGKATQEYLNYFSERGVDVYQALANSTGADKSNIAEMVTDGDISGETAAQAILDYIDATYGGLSEKLATTYDAMVDNLGDYQADMDAAMGEGYNEGRKAGLQAQMDWMSGESGAAIEESNRAIGAWKAELENQKEQYIREAMDTMMESEEYQTAKAEGDASEMGRLIMQAKVDGMNEYNASDGAQLALESEKALIEGIRNDTGLQSDYWDTGYELGNEFTKGLAAARLAQPGVYDPKPYGYDAMLDDPYIANAWNSHAFGLKRVPYDGYPALLHQGEEVRTAEEARRSGTGGVVVNVSGNSFNVRSDGDIDAIAQAIAERVRAAGMAYGG